MVTIANFAKLSNENGMDVLGDQMDTDNQEYLEEREDIKEEKFIGLSQDIAMRDDDGGHGQQILESEIDNVVIPRGLDYGNQEIQRKGVKNTFYCEVCYVPLSSLETMKSHTSGAKHQKKMLALERDQQNKIRLGMSDASQKLPGVIQVPNPESTKVKIPIRLHERIRGTEEPVIGLKYIQEFLAASDPEMEPFYKCTLCGSVGTSNSMFSHLMGFKHRQTFVDVSGSGQSSKRGGKSLSQMELLRFARDKAENGEKLDRYIVTTRSDIDYPAWPAGKAPWAIERGGSGIPPEAVRARMESKPDIKDLSKRSDRSQGIVKLKALKNYKPATLDEAIKMKDLGKYLMELALKSPHGPADADKLINVLDSLTFHS